MSEKMELSSVDVSNYASIIAELTPLAIDLALKLIGVFQSLKQGDTTTLDTQAITADQATVDKVNAWLTSKGLSSI